MTAADQLRDELYALYARELDLPLAQQDALHDKITTLVRVWAEVTGLSWPPSDFLKRPTARS